jgi:hypothetical protein
MAVFLAETAQPAYAMTRPPCAKVGVAHAQVAEQRGQLGVARMPARIHDPLVARPDDRRRHRLTCPPGRPRRLAAGHDGRLVPGVRYRPIRTNTFAGAGRIGVTVATATHNQAHSDPTGPI